MLQNLQQTIRHPKSILQTMMNLKAFLTSSPINDTFLVFMSSVFRNSLLLGDSLLACNLASGGNVNTT